MRIILTILDFINEAPNIMYVTLHSNPKLALSGGTGDSGSWNLASSQRNSQARVEPHTLKCDERRARGISNVGRMNVIHSSVRLFVCINTTLYGTQAQRNDFRMLKLWLCFTHLGHTPLTLSLVKSASRFSTDDLRLISTCRLSSAYSKTAIMCSMMNQLIR